MLAGPVRSLCTRAIGCQHPAKPLSVFQATARVAPWTAYRAAGSMAATELSERWSRDGVVWPLRILAEDEAEKLGNRLLDKIGDLTKFKKDDRMYYKSNLVFSEVNELAHHPAVLEHVSTILGCKDLLLWESAVPIKPPESGGFFPWHQDHTYWGIKPEDGVVSCWLALAPSPKDRGCVRYVKGSHRQGQMDHSLRPQAESMARRGQTVDVDEEDATLVELKAGEMSCHHGWVLHASAANVSPEPRVGVVLTYVRPSTRPHTDVGSATLVSGSCDAPWWVLSTHNPKPDQSPDDPASLEAHRLALSQHRGDMIATAN